LIALPQNRSTGSNRKVTCEDHGHIVSDLRADHFRNQEIDQTRIELIRRIIILFLIKKDLPKKEVKKNTNDEKKCSYIKIIFYIICKNKITDLLDFMLPVIKDNSDSLF